MSSSPIPPLNFFDPEYRRDPYPTLATLRAQDPVHKTPFGWIVTRHADVARLARDPRCGRDTRKMRGGGLAALAGDHKGLAEMLGTFMIRLDPPDHTRIRKLVAYAFTPKAITQMEQSVRAVAAELLEALPDEGELELMRAFARPFPVRVIAELMQVPETRRSSNSGVPRSPSS
jgi:pimeloyl-[acyl-carrier protein] synthase